VYFICGCVLQEAANKQVIFSDEKNNTGQDLEFGNAQEGASPTAKTWAESTFFHSLSKLSCSTPALTSTGATFKLSNASALLAVSVRMSSLHHTDSSGWQKLL
jgi:hypothetical protein